MIRKPLPARGFQWFFHVQKIRTTLLCWSCVKYTRKYVANRMEYCNSLFPAMHTFSGVGRGSWPLISEFLIFFKQECAIFRLHQSKNLPKSGDALPSPPNKNPGSAYPSMQLQMYMYFVITELWRLPEGRFHRTR